MKKRIICLLLAASVIACSGCTSDKKLNEKIDSLAKKMDTLIDKYDELDYGEEIHDIYDDTKVVEAYKNDDDSELTDEKDKYIFEQASKAVKEIIKDGMTDYEKEKAVYDYMFENTRYDDAALAAIDAPGDNSHNPYGFFHDHSVICVGNATTFKLFMDMLDIENDIIHSTEDGEHAWNIVKIDGDWYHVDLTFDGSEGKNPAYVYFNVTDKAKGNDYPWNREDYPECTATKHCYAVENAVKLDSVYDIPTALKKAIDTKKSAVYIKIDVPKDANADRFSLELITLFNMISNDNYSFGSGSCVSVDNGKSVVLTVVINSYDDNYITDDGNTVIDLKKMGDKFDEVFDGEVNIDYYDYAEEDDDE